MQMINIASKLAAIQDQSLLRQRRTVSARNGKSFVINHQAMTNFAGNDYLGLAQDHRVQDAFITSAKEFGYGSGSSALISGYTSAHQQLEEYFAYFLNRERALLFNSGYHANLGVITSFANRHTRVIADKHCHASIIDAIVLSRARHQRYRHHDYQHADELLQAHPEQQTLLVTESVFSMTGAITDASQLSALAHQHRATLMLDDAHGFGILGDYGKGICEHHHLSAHDVSLLITPLGKAIAGMGAIVSGDHDTIELLMQHARTYRYSTALPPADCAAALASLQIIQSESWRLHHLRNLIDFFNREAKVRNLSLISTDITPIKCILSGSNAETLRLQEKLIANNIFVAAIRPPTVPQDSARLRISLSTLHNEADISLLLDMVTEHYEYRAS